MDSGSWVFFQNGDDAVVVIWVRVGDENREELRSCWQRPCLGKDELSVD